MHILRIISGEAKGHKLKTPKGTTTRPTSDRVKESLFNIIAPYLADAKVLDIFAGTGNLGIEALSRGAGEAVFIDKSPQCTDIIRENLIHTKLSHKAQILTGDAFNAISKLKGQGIKFDIVFMDPPYSKNMVQEALLSISDGVIIKDGTIVIAERDLDDPVDGEVGCLCLIRNQKYGDTVLSFYSVKGQA